ncbi:MAG TPA: ABC transporter substrate-binding protein [Candidatus Limnocylindria bacterium]|nr:ABC transporter substrate-binding protein [Candidatus Limnocylindria bacterium]
MWTSSRTAALALVLAASAVAGAAQSPRDVVTSTSEAVIAVLKQPGVSKAEKRSRIEDIVLKSMDFETLARLTMARNWTKLTPAQQEEFRQEFRRHLSATYGRRIDDYRNETVTVLGTREEARGDQTVKTRINRGGGTADVLVDYRLRQRDGEWKIIDVVIEGVSLVANFRSQFQELMAQGGAENLLAALRRKTAEEQRQDAAEGQS